MFEDKYLHNCTLRSAKLNDTDSGSCSNKAVGHQTTSYRALLYYRKVPVDITSVRLLATNMKWRGIVIKRVTLSVKDIRQSALSTTLHFV